MILTIDTSENELVILRLNKNGKTFSHKFSIQNNLSERLIPEIEKFLKKNKIKSAQIKKIEAFKGPGHFSRIRSGVATANALAYALGVKQGIVVPQYGKGPNITLKKNSA